ncbi:antitoxin [Novosphingobium sp. AAP83]|uniref:type II toxin-antitoxin system ParD family antitoxin n=1 Tax=Novosphingobium sp. AAP83 TaxID=1523425 RepID=UPI0006B8D3B9|nr:type II toxin-antitoxin system ParD family antitoxin [Novosphingobium sp. AAP83]KPF92053.1 antitoxin [Novosphingobium sp. AAP83]
MARNTSVTIGEHFTNFIAAQVSTGRYGSASDVVRAGLRLLEDHEAKVRALELALIEGEETGEPEPFDFDEFLQRMNREYNAR